MPLYTNIEDFFTALHGDEKVVEADELTLNDLRQRLGVGSSAGVERMRNMVRAIGTRIPGPVDETNDWLQGEF